MATSKELRAQAAELIKQAEAIEQKEKDDARDAILSLMREAGLTPEDILGKGQKGLHLVSKNKGRSTGPVAVQFQNPDTGETWTGRGRAPAWIKDQDREKFRVKTAA